MFLFGSADKSVNPFDKGTGGINDLNTLLFKTGINILSNAMGADNHRLTGLRLLRRIDHTYPEVTEFVHHMTVMDDGSKGYYLFSVPCCLFYQFYRTADTEAESGTLCLRDHNGIFSPMMRFSSAMTPSISRSEVSTLMESRANFRGATSRWVS